MDTAAFVRANSSILPKVDVLMLLEFMKQSDKHNIAEIRGVKALMSSRESYVESAVGYVEVKRSGTLCDVRAKVVPEHRISNKYYVVTIHLDEANENIIDTSCEGCAAAAGGCKHTLVLLYWLQKRSAEPSPTSVQCYWLKPSLSSARQEVVQCKAMYTANSKQMGPKDSSILDKFRTEARKYGCSNSLILAYDNKDAKETLNIYCMFDIMVAFVAKENDHSYENFKIFSDNKVQNVKNKICTETIGQVNSKLWHCMRQGRITGSKVHEVAHCKTPNGSLSEELLGGYKLEETKAMKRGKKLEKEVIMNLQRELNKEIEDSGFILINGLFGASPDGVGDDFVVEVKCPISDKTKTAYINNGKISNKFMGQVQMEMLAANKMKCLFCVADPGFERNGIVEIVVVDYDEKYIVELMIEAETFWKNNVFPRILSSAKVVP